MRNVILFILMILFCQISWAQQVNKRTAELVAKNFYYEMDPSATSRQQVQITSTDVEADRLGALIYRVNIGNSGFVIVAGDEQTVPILAYSINAGGDLSETNPGYLEWLEQKKSELREIKANPFKPTISSEQSNWEKLKDPNYQKSGSRFFGVGPLMSSTWGQGGFYNDSCPSNASGQAIVGCVAVAMGQIMRYHGAPTKGVGSSSYNHSTYGNLFANYGNTTYNWSNMPDALSSANSDVADFLRDAGVSVEMNYGTGSSGACSCDVDDAMEDHWNYETDGYERKSDFTDAEWKTKLRNELDNDRPIYMRGTGHAWVCDGYYTIIFGWPVLNVYEYFHMNWGWNGSFNGNFLLDDLTPGTRDYNSGERMVKCVPPSADLRIVNTFVNDHSLISFQNFTVSTTIRNDGPSSSGASYVEYWLSSNAYLSSYDTYLGNDYVSSIGANSTGYEYEGLTVPLSLKGSGTYYLYYKADATNSIRELDESNNTAYEVVTVIDLFRPEENENDLSEGLRTDASGEATISDPEVYPNPAAFGMVNLKYELANSQDVVVRIQDINGRVLDEVTNGYQNAGVNHVRYDVSNLEAGWYIYSIQQEDGSMINKKFMIIK